MGRWVGIVSARISPIAVIIVVATIVLILITLTRLSTASRRVDLANAFKLVSGNSGE
jgi:hypothetical protein